MSVEERGGRQEGEDWSITKGIREMMQRAVWMQEMMGSVADRVEKIHNLFNFTVPFISGVFYCVLLLLMGLLYLVPIRYYHSLSSLSRTFKLPIRWLLLAWGLNKFRKGLVRRGERQQGKLANLLAKVPHNEKLVRARRCQCTTTPQLDYLPLPALPLHLEDVKRLQRKASRDSIVI